MITPTNMRLSVGAFMFACFAMSFSAQAADLGGEYDGSVKDQQSFGRSHAIYGSVFGGVTFADEADFGGIVNGTPQSVITDFDTGFNVGGAVGVKWYKARLGPFVPRTEFEVSYREFEADTLNFTGNGPANETNTGGDISSTLLFANLLWDVDLGSQSRFTPYIGGGFGVALTDLDVVYGPGVRLNDDDESFAFQLIAGTAIKLSDRIDLTIDGRYTSLVDVDADRFAPNGALTGNVQDDIDDFTINAGLRFNLY